MNSPLADHRGPRSRLPEKPGALHEAAALLYGSLAWLTGQAQALGCRRVRTRKPLLSVGNLEVGGTGKTPAVEALARLCLERSRRPGILTGCYGGSRSALLARDSRAFAEQAPDEARLLAERLPDTPVLAAGRKWRGALALDEDPDCDLIILDDGFQHRRLARDFDLVLLSPNAPLRARRALPAGPLREFPAALARAHAFALPDAIPAPPLPERPLWHFRMVEDGLRDWAGRPVADGGERFLVISAIANPERFEEAVAPREIVGRLRFADHAPWNASIRRLIAAAMAADPRARPLMTEKDAVRWRRSWDIKGKTPYSLGVRLIWSDPEGLWDWLSRGLERRRSD